MPTLPPDPRDGIEPRPAHREPTLPPGAAPKPTLPPPGPVAKGPVLPPSGLKLPPGGSGKPAPPPGASGDGGASAADKKAWATDQDVRWCPGCGDYAILAAMQRLMPELGVPREKTVFVSGIGCSSRFPYYMNTYGFHSIHGRAPAIATGLKAARPDLDVWMITGDGDALSIGAGHFVHLLRRNLNLQVVLFNNQIYGLTKGQYSPTSEPGKVTKSTPFGSLDHPFNPLSLALGADASFVARGLDRDPKHLAYVLRRAHQHTGTSLIEVYQNCNIFNDGAFFEFTERDTKPIRTVMVEHGKPLVFDGGKKGIRLDGLRLDAFDLTAPGASVNDCLVYDETDRELAHVATRMMERDDLPRPFGVLYREDRPSYEASLHAQAEEVLRTRGKGDLTALLRGSETWEVT